MRQAEGLAASGVKSFLSPLAISQGSYGFCAKWRSTFIWKNAFPGRIGNRRITFGFVFVLNRFFLAIFFDVESTLLARQQQQGRTQMEAQ